MPATSSSETDPRSRIVEATMRLAARRPFGEIAIRDIAAEAGVSLLQFRDAFPSKGAVLAALSRMIDRETLSVDYAFRPEDGPHERLFAVLSRRLDALGPYRDGLKSVRGWLSADWSAALEINKLEINAMRFVCEAAGVETGGALANIKLQGLALAWMRVVDVWLNDDEPGQVRALAALNAELSRGERAVAGLDNVAKVFDPAMARLREGFARPGATRDEKAHEDLSTPL